MAYWTEGTTNIRGAAFGNPTRDELLRAGAGAAPVLSRATNLAPTADATRGEGTLTKYRPVGGWATPAPGTNLVAASAELGEPTSFRGGAGAPEPIAVMRGRNMTFSPGRQPGEQFAGPEVATDLQARQAWNRGLAGQNLVAADRLPAEAQAGAQEGIRQTFGEYQAPGTALAETRGRLLKEAYAAENKAPEKVAAAETIQQQREKVEREQAGGEFDKLLQASAFSSFDPSKGALAFKPKDEHMARDQVAARNIAMAQKSAQAGLQHFQDRQNIRQWLTTQPLQPGFNINAFLDAAATNPQHWQGLVNDAKKVIGVSRPSATAGIPPGSLMAAGEAPIFPQ